MDNLTYRKVCLLNEVETSIRLIKKGMSDLQKISGENDFYHAPILMLSSGFERLIKCLICLANWNDKTGIDVSPFPKTHDVIYLLDEILLKICDEKNYAEKFPAAKNDIYLLKNDQRAREIIGLLSEFAQGGRYYYLDWVIAGDSEYENPEDIWQKIEAYIVKDRKDILELLTNKKLNDAYREINKELIISLEKFARALSRLFTLADFGKFAEQASPLVFDYLMLRNEDLGTKQY